ncbi:MAG: hypothetical protein ACRC6E_02715, partial [Fusobacteriaceae bacterium]
MTSFIEVVAPDNTAHNSSSGIVFHHRGTSTSALYYKNDDLHTGYFNFKSDDTSYNVRVNGSAIYHRGDKPTAADVGLGNVGNYSAVNKGGDRMTGALTIDSHDVNMIIPETTGGHARGTVIKNRSNVVIGGYGWLGGGTGISWLGGGFGTNFYGDTTGLKWSTNQVKFNNNAIYHRGDKPTAAEIGAMVDGGSYGTIYLNNWIRTSGSTGWYSQTYGGGWYMVDTTWIRTYGSKP